MTFQHVHELFAAGLTVIWKDDLAALQRDRETLAALRREALRLRLDVLFLLVDLDRCLREMELCRGW